MSKKKTKHTKPDPSEVRKALIQLHPALFLVLDRMEWVLEPLLTELQELEQQEMELKAEISALKGTPATDTPLTKEEKHVSFNVAARVIKAAQIHVTDEKILKVLKKRKLSDIPENEYPVIVKKLKRLIKEATHKK